MRCRPLVSLAFLAILAGPDRAPAATYWVAPPPIGSDAHLGTLEKPWATLQRAASSIGPGDTVVVRAGSYAGAQLATSGTSAQRITLRAYPGELVRIVADSSAAPDGINLEGASFVTVEGFVVEGHTRAGIRAVECEHVTLRGNLVDDNGRWGIFTGFCDDLLIAGNVASNSHQEHGIYVSNSGDRPTIRGNLIFGNHANGIHMNGDLSQGGDGVISGALVERNVISGNGQGGGSGINCDGVQDSILRNNLIFDTHASGISLYRIDGGAPSSGNRVLHHTVLVASDGRWALNVRDGSTGNTVRNNVLHSAHSYRGAITISVDSLPGFTSDSNALEGRFTTDDGNSVLTLAQWRALTGQDHGSFATDLTGLFADPGAGDYRPVPGGALVDAGEARPDVTDDLAGTPRPLRDGPDIGAYEWDPRVRVETFESGGLDRWSRRKPAP
ncbi:MAG TPA: NosD domain-containing protein [Thermoanaerobaculia bacterium]|nr:NosD domain-containing protein [Thermoanaerobaculia bacterium]